MYGRIGVVLMSAAAADEPITCLFVCVCECFWGRCAMASVNEYQPRSVGGTGAGLHYNNFGLLNAWL